MGIRVEIGGRVYNAIDYRVSEDATPLAAGDSMAAVSVMSITIPRPDPHAPMDGDATGAAYILKHGAHSLERESVILTDSRRGFIVGVVDSTSVDDRGNTITLTCLSRMGGVAAHNISAAPYFGTLAGAFAYYLSLVGMDDVDTFRVEPEVANRQVAYVGWQGELWQHLKMMAAAENCEITLVSGIIVLRPIRTRTAIRGRSISSGRGASVTSIARAVEVYSYNTRAVENGTIYPPRWMSPDELEIITVAPLETVEYQIELGASVSSIIPPVPSDNYNPGDTHLSAYTVADDAGRRVGVAPWIEGGGELTVTINPDTTTATVRVRGAAIYNEERTRIPSFTISFGGAHSLSNSLHILGTGVEFEQTKHRVVGGVPEREAGTDVGVTVDNPFARTVSQAVGLGLGAAKNYARMSSTLNGELVSISPRGDRGGVLTPTYDEVRQEIYTALGTTTPTWEQAAGYYQSLGLATYGDVQNYYEERAAEGLEEQVFGNAQGVRYWDDEMRRWYRVRSATITPSTIAFDADDDLIVEDMQKLYEGVTYAEVQAIFDGMTYRQAGGMGMYRG